MPHKMVSRISAQTKMWPVKNPKNSRERAKNVRARHFWAKRASNRSENRIIVISAIFPFREVSTWPIFLKLIFLLRKRFQFFLLGYHGYKGQIYMGIQKAKIVKSVPTFHGHNFGSFWARDSSKKVPGFLLLVERARDEQQRPRNWGTKKAFFSSWLALTNGFPTT